MPKPVMLSSLTKRARLASPRGPILVEVLGEPIHRPGVGLISVRSIKTGHERVVLTSKLTYL